MSEERKDLRKEEKIEELQVGGSSEPCKSTTSFAPTHFVRRENQDVGVDIRSRVLPVRFTLSEHRQIHERSLALNVSLSEYVRRAALQRKLPPLAAPILNRAVYEELCRVGNNLNQLLRAIHTGKVTSVGLELLHELQAVLRTLGREVLGGRSA